MLCKTSRFFLLFFGGWSQNDDRLYSQFLIAQTLLPEAVESCLAVPSHHQKSGNFQVI
jgi:hypothetical protein